MGATVVDDHLLREILVGRLDETLGGLTPDGVAVTGLWLFRLCSSFADPSVVGKLSGPVVSLSEDLQALFRAQLVAPPASIEVLSLQDLAWSMALLQTRHHAEGGHSRRRWSKRSPLPTGSAGGRGVTRRCRTESPCGRRELTVCRSMSCTGPVSS